MRSEVPTPQRADHFHIRQRPEVETLRILGGQYPTCIRNFHFTDDGFVLDKTTGDKLVPLYVAGLENISSSMSAAVMGPLIQMGYHIMDPVTACEEYYSATTSDLGSRDKIESTISNEVLIPRSKVMVAFLEGNEADYTISADIARMALQQGQVVGIKLNPNLEQQINGKITSYLDEELGGALFENINREDVPDKAFIESLFYLARLHGELLNPPAAGEVSHRTSPLRGLQNALPAYITDQSKKGRFPGTKIEATINAGEQLHADDITLSQLQMTDYICKMIKEGKPFPDFEREYILTSLLNGADGPVARRLGTVSKEGGIKDASVDRLSEIMVVNLIAEKTGMSPKLAEELRVSFQLSTLTKAACEMGGVKTREGGVGGMINRRMALFFILRDLIKINNLGEGSDSEKNTIIGRINSRVHKLIEVSQEKALERIDIMAERGIRLVQAPINPASSGASEARKFAAICSINNRTGVDIIDKLNTLAKGRVVFSSLHSLVVADKYIESSLGRAEEFLGEAIRIAGYEN